MRWRSIERGEGLSKGMERENERMIERVGYKVLLGIILLLSTFTLAVLHIRCLTDLCWEKLTHCEVVREITDMTHVYRKEKFKHNIKSTRLSL